MATPKKNVQDTAVYREAISALRKNVKDNDTNELLDDVLNLYGGIEFPGADVYDFLSACIALQGAISKAKIHESLLEEMGPQTLDKATTLLARFGEFTARMREYNDLLHLSALRMAPDKFTEAEIELILKNAKR